MGVYASYFERAALVWSAYFAGRLSLSARDAALAALRAEYGIR